MKKQNILIIDMNHCSIQKIRIHKHNDSCLFKLNNAKILLSTLSQPNNKATLTS